MPAVITAAEVFSDSDAEHPAATIARVGGGTYIVALLVKGQPIDKVEAATYDDAVIAADKHSADIDALPTTPDEKIILTRALKEKQEQIDVLTARVAELEALLDPLAVDARVPKVL